MKAKAGMLTRPCACSRTCSLSLEHARDTHPPLQNAKMRDIPNRFPALLSTASTAAAFAPLQGSTTCGLSRRPRVRTPGYAYARHPVAPVAPVACSHLWHLWHAATCGTCGTCGMQPVAPVACSLWHLWHAPVACSRAAKAVAPVAYAAALQALAAADFTCAI